MLPLQALLDERVLDAPDHLLDILPVGVYVCDGKASLSATTAPPRNYGAALRRSAIQLFVSAAPIVFMA